MIRRYFLTVQVERAPPSLQLVLVTSLHFRFAHYIILADKDNFLFFQVAPNVIFLLLFSLCKILLLF